MTFSQREINERMRLFDSSAVGMCQLTHINEIARKNSWLNDKVQYLIRKFRYYRRTILQNVWMKKMNYAHIPEKQEPIQPGDIVQVCSKTEILQTLDRSRKTKGCTFQTEMFKHCEKEFKVYKKVHYFFDERKQKMCRCYDTYLLEGCFCSGKTAYLKSCDRNCYFFWQKTWLKKV